MPAKQPETNTGEEPVPEEPPPILGTWRRAYTVVIVTQVVLLGLFYAVTVAYQ